MSDDTATPFAEWAILELMGHRRLAGRVTEQEIAGHGFLRLDVPGLPLTSEHPATPDATQFYAPAAVYAITPCSEDTARRVAQMSQVAPVSEWELPRLGPSSADPDDTSPVDDLGF